MPSVTVKPCCAAAVPAIDCQLQLFWSVTFAAAASVSAPPPDDATASTRVVGVPPGAWMVHVFSTTTVAPVPPLDAVHLNAQSSVPSPLWDDWVPMTTGVAEASVTEPLGVAYTVTVTLAVRPSTSA